MGGARGVSMPPPEWIFEYFSNQVSEVLQTLRLGCPDLETLAQWTRTPSDARKSIIQEDENFKKRKKTRFLTIIFVSENCDLWVDFVILLEARYGSHNCWITLPTTEKEILDSAKLSQTLAQSFMNSKTHFIETEKDMILPPERYKAKWGIIEIFWLS